MQLSENLLAFIAPHYCIECGAEGKLLCEACTPNVFGEVSSNCVFCSAPTDKDSLCKKCRQNGSINQAWALGEYDGVYEKLIHLLKFARARAAYKLLAGELHRQLPPLLPGTLVVPLPTAPKRVRQRGYDQSGLLARQFAKQRGLKFAPLLARLHNERQVGATRTERQLAAQKAYKLNVRAAGKAPILLIDDVVTTGASLKAAAAVCAEAGFSPIQAAVVARRAFKK